MKKLNSLVSFHAILLLCATWKKIQRGNLPFRVMSLLSRGGCGKNAGAAARRIFLVFFLATCCLFSNSADKNTDSEHWTKNCLPSPSSDGTGFYIHRRTDRILMNLVGLVVWVLRHINLCRLFNTESIFIQIISSISNNSV